MPDTERSCSIENITAYAAVFPEHQIVGRPLRAMDGCGPDHVGGCGPVDQRAARLARRALEADGGVARVESCGDLRRGARIGCALVPATTPGW